MRSPICFMNLRSRAAALPSILPSAAIQLSQPGPQESGPPLMRANAIGAEWSAIRGEAAGFFAGLASAAGLAGTAGLACTAGFGGEAGLAEIAGLLITGLPISGLPVGGLLIAGVVVGGTAANDAEPVSTAVSKAAAICPPPRRIENQCGVSPTDTIATRPHAPNT
ncbi:exported hypothetical protein [Bradyrhizobium sp. ORS 375]|nr:exported hypothetical protein [Bradyrhizobium sp. ORS 375]